jgi:hypothetical protein
MSAMPLAAAAAVLLPAALQRVQPSAQASQQIPPRSLAHRSIVEHLPINLRERFV